MQTVKDGSAIGLVAIHGARPQAQALPLASRFMHATDLSLSTDC